MGEIENEKSLEQIQKVFHDPVLKVQYHHGDDFLVIEVNDTWMFRFPRSKAAPEVLEVEIKFLPLFAPLSPVPVPEYVLHSPGFIGYRKITGVWLTRQVLNELPENRQLKIAQQLGGFLSALHTFSVEQARQLGMTEGWGGWRNEAYQRFRDNVLMRLSIASRKNALRCLEAYFAWKYVPVVVHGDFYPHDHVLLDPARGEICGVIDFGDITLEDPAIDLKSLLQEFGEQYFQRILQHYTGKITEGLLQHLQTTIQASTLLEAVYDIQFGYPGRLAAHLRLIESQFGH